MDEFAARACSRQVVPTTRFMNIFILCNSIRFRHFYLFRVRGLYLTLHEGSPPESKSTACGRQVIQESSPMLPSDIDMHTAIQRRRRHTNSRGASAPTTTRCPVLPQNATQSWISSGITIAAEEGRTGWRRQASPDRKRSRSV
jgi:hypothetical protein